MHDCPSRERRPKKFGAISTPKSIFGPSWNPWVQKQVLSVFPSFCLKKKKTKQQTLHIFTTPPWKSRVESCFPSPRPTLITGERKCRWSVASGLRHVKLLLPTLDTFATTSAVKFQLSFAVLSGSAQWKNRTSYEWINE